MKAWMSFWYLMTRRLALKSLFRVNLFLPYWCFLPHLMRCWSTWNYLIAYAVPIDLLNIGFLFATSITLHQWYCVPLPHWGFWEFITIVPCVRMDPSWYTKLTNCYSCLPSLIIYWYHPWDSVPIQPNPGFVRPLGTWWATFQMQGGCYIYSVTWTLLVLP